MRISEFLKSILEERLLELGLVLFSISGILLIVPEARTFLRGNSGPLSAVLTIFLVFLYFAQYRTQKNQQELMQLANEPFLRVEGYRGAMGDLRPHNLELDLSNIGDGIAYDLRLRIETEIPHPQYIGRSSERHLMEKSGKEYNWFTYESDYIKPDTQNTEFYAGIGVSWKHLPSNTLSSSVISSTRNRFQSDGIERFRVKAKLVYSSRADKEKCEPIFDLMIPVRDDLRTVNDILHYGLDYEQYIKSAETPGNPFDSFSYSESPVGLTKYENSGPEPDERQSLSLEELEDKLSELDSEYVYARVVTGLVVPMFVTKVSPSESGLIVEGRKEIDDKAPVKIKKKDDGYYLYEDSKFQEGWVKKNEIVNVIRKMDS